MSASTIPAAALAAAKARFAAVEAALAPVEGCDHSLVYDYGIRWMPLLTYHDEWTADASSSFTSSVNCSVNRSYTLSYVYPAGLCLGYEDRTVDDLGGPTVRTRTLRRWDRAGDGEIVKAAPHLDRFLNYVTEQLRRDIERIV